MEEFIYKDVDYLQTPDGWLEARLNNRLKEGFEIWRDDEQMAWCGIKKNAPTPRTNASDGLDELSE